MTTRRRHVTAEGHREAVYSECETYRYSLTATWNADGRRLLYVMLNPSKATELANDPTIERCERRARNLGYGAFGVVNLFALRETSPQKLKAAKLPDGPENAAFIRQSAAWADDIMAAWGVHGSHRGACDSVLPILRASGSSLFHLGLTKGGHPRHPLYIAYRTDPILWA